MVKRVLSLAIALALLTAPANAFQSTSGSNTKLGSGALADKDKKLNLSNDAAVIDKSSGTTVRIPGLGALGVLPKLDFGLELLYSDNPPPVVEQREIIGNDADGLSIKGTLKHRF